MALHAAIFCLFAALCVLPESAMPVICQDTCVSACRYAGDPYKVHECLPSPVRNITGHRARRLEYEEIASRDREIPYTQLSVVVADEMATDVIRTLLSHVHFFMHRILNTSGVDFYPEFSMWTIASHYPSPFPKNYIGPFFGDYDTFMTEAVMLELTAMNDREFAGKAVSSIASRFDRLHATDRNKFIDLSPTLDLIFYGHSRWRDCVILFVLPATAYVNFLIRDLEALAAWNCTVHAILDLGSKVPRSHIAFGPDAYLSLVPGAPPAMHRWRSPVPAELKSTVLRRSHGLGNVVFDTGGIIFSYQSLYPDAAAQGVGLELHSRARYVVAEMLARLAMRNDIHPFLKTSRCRCGDRRADPEMLKYHANDIPEHSRSPYLRSLVPPLRDRGCLSYCEDETPNAELMSQQDSVNQKYATCSTEAVYSEPEKNSTECVESSTLRNGTTTYQQASRVADIVVLVEESVPFINRHRLLPALLLALERNLQGLGFGTENSGERNHYAIIGMGTNEGFLGRFITSACSQSYLYPVECTPSAAAKLRATAGEGSKIDSYAGLLFAVANTPWRGAALRNVLLLTSRDWYPGYGSVGVTTAAVSRLLACYDIALHAFVDNRFADAAGDPVSGASSLDGPVAGNTVAGRSGLVSIGDGSRRTDRHLVMPALRAHGSAWDIERMTAASLSELSAPAIARLNAQRHTALFTCSACTPPRSVSAGGGGGGDGVGMETNGEVRCVPACDQDACVLAVQDGFSKRRESEREDLVLDEDERYQNTTGCRRSHPLDLFVAGCALRPANVFLLVDLGAENHRLHLWLPYFVARLETELLSNEVGQGRGAPLARRNLYTVIGFDHAGITLVPLPSATGRTSVPAELVAEAVASLPFPSRYRNEGDGFQALTDVNPVIQHSRSSAYDVLLLLSVNSAEVQPLTDMAVPEPGFYCRDVFHHVLVPVRIFLSVEDSSGLSSHSVYGIDYNGTAVEHWDQRDQRAWMGNDTPTRYVFLANKYEGYAWDISNIEECTPLETTLTVPDTTRVTVTTAPVTSPVTSSSAAQHIERNLTTGATSVSSDDGSAVRGTTPQAVTATASASTVTTSQPPVPPHLTSSSPTTTASPMPAVGLSAAGGNLLGTVVPAVVSSAVLLLIVCLLIVYLRVHRAAKARMSISTAAQLMATPFPGIESTAKHAGAMLLAPMNSSVKVMPSALLRLGRCIGKGQFGVVHLGWLASRDEKSRTVDDVVAIKTLRSLCTDEAAHSALIEEYLLQKSIGSHPNVVDMIIGGLYEGRACIVMEYMSGGDLHSFLRNIKNSQTLPAAFTPMLTRSEGVDICRQISLGMNFLASKHVIHRDLAARNILVREHFGKLDVKISDLGLSRCTLQTGVYQAQTSRLLPMKWMAPESIMEGRFSLESDVWSFAVVMWEVETCGETPYKGKPNALLPDLLAKGHRLVRPEGCHDDIYHLMLQCWSADPDDRPSFGDITERLNTQLETHMNYIQMEDVSTEVTIVVQPGSVSDDAAAYNKGRRPSALQYLLGQMRERSVDDDADRLTPVPRLGSDGDAGSDASAAASPVESAMALSSNSGMLTLSHNSAMMHRYILQPIHGSREDVFQEHEPPPTNVVE